MYNKKEKINETKYLNPCYRYSNDLRITNKNKNEEIKK